MFSRGYRKRVLRNMLKNTGFYAVRIFPSEAAARGVLWKEVFLEISQKFTGKHLCQSLFFNKVAGMRPATLLKKRLWHRCFPVKFAEFLRTPFLRNTSGKLLLLCFGLTYFTPVFHFDTPWTRQNQRFSDAFKGRR